MSWVKKDKSTRTFVFAIAVMGLVTAGLWFGAQFNSTQANTNNLTLAAAPAATFNGANVGAIPDAATGNCWGAFVPTPRNVTFNVTGVTGPPSNVELSTTFSPIHSWVGDVRATLIAPNGASHIVFGTHRRDDFDRLGRLVGFGGTLCLQGFGGGNELVDGSLQPVIDRSVDGGDVSDDGRGRRGTDRSGTGDEYDGGIFNRRESDRNVDVADGRRLCRRHGFDLGGDADR